MLLSIQEKGGTLLAKTHIIGTFSWAASNDGNLLVSGVIVGLFLLFLIMPSGRHATSEEPSLQNNWTARLRKSFDSLLSVDTWLPMELPEYATGFFYTLGSLTASSFAVLVLSGAIMAANRPSWWFGSPWGYFFRSVHFWAVQSFFFFMALHLLRVFFHGAWRGRREKTWMAGALLLLTAIPTAFTGYLMRGDFFAQWNAVQAKDGLNALGLAWFNTLNTGQMYGLHIMVLPSALGLLIIVHIALVRTKGVVPPYPHIMEEDRDIIPEPQWKSGNPLTQPTERSENPYGPG